jgi:subtilisin-like proprotein convertase family protein
MKWISTLILSALCLATTFAQQNFWNENIGRALTGDQFQDRHFKVAKYRTLALDLSGLQAALQAAPLETTLAGSNPVELLMPMPDGSMKRFLAVESPVMAPGLAARYPAIKTYKGWNPEQPKETIRFGYSPDQGFYATILAAEGAVYIDALEQGGERLYLAYFVAENAAAGLRSAFICETEEEHGHEPEPGIYEGNQLETRSPAEEEGVLRTYRLAMAVTGEYSIFHGGTTASALAAVVLKVNRLNQVFERDLAIRAELVENNDTLIFLDPATDSLSNGNTSALLGEIADVINSRIGQANYDFGHVLNRHNDFVGNGVAALRSVCNPLTKARGVSGITIPQGDPFVIAIIAHEMGHQFGATHTMNDCQNVESSTAYEPGSGVTIMAYAGICQPSNNVQNFTEDFFHIISMEQIFEYTREGNGDGCAVKTPTGNLAPTVEVPNLTGTFIPISTPFQLTASATDPENDLLTYAWEQFDTGPTNVGLGNPQGNSPLFRVFQPSTSPTRVFPRLNKIVNNSFDVSEILPTYSRDLTFRCAVRDNNPGGGNVTWAQTRFRSDDTAGPFRVTVPNDSGIEWEVGDYREIRWDVANTDNNRVRCYRVNIKLSTDGGFTYPITLLEGVPNTGSAFVTIPDAVTSTARIRVEAADNIFFDISNANFAIGEPSAPGYAMTASPANIRPVCLPEPTVVQISTSALLGFDEPIALSLEGELPAEASVTFADNPILPGETTTMTIDWGTFVNDTFRLQIVGITESLDTSYRFLEFATVSNDYSELALLTPEDGTSDIVVSTPFSWTSVPDAERYDFQLATSPSFGPTNIAAANGLTGTGHTPNVLLETNQLYFWRIRPVNECGPNEWLPPFAFRTAAVDCVEFSANDLPVSIANAANTTRTSRIFVPVSGTINDVNLRNVNLSFQPVNSMRLVLKSPAGTEVRLYSQNCLNTGLIRLGFDDEAPTGILCPPDNNQLVRPFQPLSALDGEDSFGEWALEARVMVSGFGGGGSFQSWTLEFCAALTPESPTLFVNEPLAVPPGQSNIITQGLLEAADGNSNPDQIVYTLLTLPAHGQLVRTSLGETLTVGSRFTQSTINAFNLSYVHDGSASQSDSFTFIVENNQGGWLPTQTFRIDIDENAMVNVPEVPLANGITLFPNPAQDMVQIRFERPVPGRAQVRLFNLSGQEVERRLFPDTAAALELSTVRLAAGLYIVSVQTETGVFAEKLLIQK